MKDKTIKITVPATSANLGPGFDTLGVALKMHNTMTLSLKNVPAVVLKSPLPASEHKGAMKMIMTASRKFFKAAEMEPQGFEFSVGGDIPIARGLGSSSTIYIGVVEGLNRLLKKPLSLHEVLNLVSELEGHPDNVSPALLGGFVVSGVFERVVRVMRFEIPQKLKFVAAIPEFEMKTSDARAVLPKEISLKAGVANVNRVALMIAAISQGQYACLEQCFDDEFHQPYRKKLLPMMDDVIAAGKGAGALGGWLSGAGSTIMCLTLQNPKDVGEAMTNIFKKHGIKSEAKILTVDNDGTRISG